MEHILIVEDDPALGRGLTLALGGAHACTLASGCADARRALAAATFDLAIFDINLPDGSGLALLEETRDTLLDRIWTDGADYVDENALSVTVGRLRRKLGKNAPIKTVYGVGYSWAVET